MKNFLALALAASFLTFGGQAFAAEIDMSQLKCSAVAGMPAARKTAIGMWMSGYVHGKAGDTMVDAKAIRDNAKALVEYCGKNRDSTVMSGMEQIAK